MGHIESNVQLNNKLTITTKRLGSHQHSLLRVNSLWCRNTSQVLLVSSKCACIYKIKASIFDRILAYSQLNDTVAQSSIVTYRPSQIGAYADQVPSFWQMTVRLPSLAYPSLQEYVYGSPAEKLLFSLTGLVLSPSKGAEHVIAKVD